MLFNFHSIPFLNRLAAVAVLHPCLAATALLLCRCLAAAAEPPPQSHNHRPAPPSQDDSVKHDYTSMKNLEKPKRGFWGVLARKARSIIEDGDDVAQQYETPERRRQQMSDAEKRSQMWIAKAEYDESGPSIVHRKCF